MIVKLRIDTWTDRCSLQARRRVREAYEYIFGGYNSSLQALSNTECRGMNNKVIDKL